MDQSFSKYLLIPYCVPNMMLSAGGKQEKYNAWSRPCQSAVCLYITSSILISASFHSFALVVMWVTEHLSLRMPCYLFVFLDCLMILKATLGLNFFFFLLLTLHFSVAKLWFWTYVLISMCVCLVSQSCLTLCDPMVCSPPGSSVHGIFQARILEWVAMPFSRESSQPRDQIQVSHTADRFFIIWVIREASLSS